MNKNITLIVLEGRKDFYPAAEKVYNYVKKFSGWGHSINLQENLTYDEAMRYELGKFLDCIHPDSTHILVCTWDGFITNPELWNNDWLKYDMIGAPWQPHLTQHRVGNTGFCLQSRKFLQTAYKYRDYYKGGPGDAFLCQTMHDTFVEEGIKYAPVEVAAKFSWEHNIPENIGGPTSSFGFHGWQAGRTPQYYYNTFLN